MPPITHCQALPRGEQASSSRPTDPPVEPLPLGQWAEMIAMLARAVGLPPKEVERRLRREHEQLGSNVCEEMAAAGLTPFVWTDQLVEFYGRTPAFLFESLTWNGMPTKIAMRRWIGAYLWRHQPGAGRVLCFGDGLGLDGAALAMTGHRVTYFEISTACQRFAREVFEVNDVDVDCAESLAELDSASFDAVVCLDVLEHVPDPGSVVGELSRLLRPSGLLIIHAPFWYLDRSVPTHLRQNLCYSGDWRQLYAPHGLRPRAGRLFWNPLVLEKSGTPLKISLGDRCRLALSTALLKLQRLGLLPMVPLCRLLLRWEQLRIQRCQERMALAQFSSSAS